MGEAIGLFNKHSKLEELFDSTAGAYISQRELPNSGSAGVRLGLASTFHGKLFRQGIHEGADVQKVYDTILVHVGFRLKDTAANQFNERFDIKQI